ncbi:MAG TPA: helix-turn-helix domain-containing protein [Caproicibacter sp.]|nr:helix-turn-helix domain-containing protein [Caproicibacter sp.]
MSSPFDGLMSFKDATDKWGLNESTLRKAVSYGKLIEGIDVKKFGKQWIITEEAMTRLYGNPKAEDQ